MKFRQEIALGIMIGTAATGIYNGCETYSAVLDNTEAKAQQEAISTIKDVYLLDGEVVYDQTAAIYDALDEAIETKDKYPIDGTRSERLIHETLTAAKAPIEDAISEASISNKFDVDEQEEGLFQMSLGLTDKEKRTSLNMKNHGVLSASALLIYVLASRDITRQRERRQKQAAEKVQV